MSALVKSGSKKSYGSVLLSIGSVMVLQKTKAAQSSGRIGLIHCFCVALALAAASCGGGGGDSCSGYGCGEFGDTDGIWQETNSGGIVIISDYGSAVDAIDIVPGHLRGIFRQQIEETTYFAFLAYFTYSRLLYNLVSDNAIVIPKNTIDVTYTSAYTNPLAMHMVYDALLSDRPSSLSLISGIWSVTEGDSTTTITIDRGGAIFGSDSDGCVYAGNTMVPTTSLNTYRINIDIKNCMDYLSDGKGQGILMDTETANDTLLFVATRTTLPTGISYVKKKLFRQ
jgi:hypothetical protein